MTQERLNEILEKHKKWLDGENDGKQAYLWFTDFVQAFLQGANLRQASLRGANLQEASLSEASLSEANLQETDLQGADLRDADLWYTTLVHADLRDADLRGTFLQHAYLGHADLRGADLRGADMRGADLDYSCWPLWCGSLDVIVDKRIAAQLAYHFCRLICDDEEVKGAQKALAHLANQFHRADECGRIEVGE